MICSLRFKKDSLLLKMLLWIFRSVKPNKYIFGIIIYNNIFCTNFTEFYINIMLIMSSSLTINWQRIVILRLISNGDASNKISLFFFYKVMLRRKGIKIKKKEWGRECLTYSSTLLIKCCSTVIVWIHKKHVFTI